MDFALSVVHPVTEVEPASHFFLNVLGFQKVTHDPYGVVVGNGSIQIRLCLASPETGEVSKLHLELTSSNLDRSREQWLKRPEVLAVSEKIVVSQERHEVRVQGPHNLNLTIFRLFNEDDLGLLPELPTSFDWSEETETAVKLLLRCVPLPFRKEARIKVTEKAEMNAAEAGEISVGMTVALHSFIQETPLFQHRALWEEMEKIDLDPKLYFPEGFDPLEEIS